MIKQWLKLSTIFGLLIIVLLWLTVSGNFYFWQDKDAPALSVYFFDVGEGDAIYIRAPNNFDVLIDGGPDKSVLAELGEAMPFWDKTIEAMILTHPHSDHVTGLVEILRRYKVRQVYLNGVLNDANAYAAWLAEIKKKQVPAKIVDNLFELQLGPEIKLQFLYPQSNIANQKSAELNDTSIVTRLVYGESEFLFAGDAGEAEEKELLDSGVILSSDVLKVGHHGSNTASSEEFLAAVNPQIAVIESGAGNEFFHPHPRTLSRLERLGVKILRTDQLGTIKLSSDGKKIIEQ
ncbi:MBL fold metallo-hydrolase [Candidatus Falkowbacteria bacterium]|nr:MBL fold metallo-hydrolase [Candidatus Falkowbacteria bacterium]